MADWEKIGVDDILSSKGTLMKEFASMQRRIANLENTLQTLAGDDLYMKRASDWHDYSTLIGGIQKIARDALTSSSDSSIVQQSKMK